MKSLIKCLLLTVCWFSFCYAAQPTPPELSSKYALWKKEQARMHGRVCLTSAGILTVKYLDYDGKIAFIPPTWFEKQFVRWGWITPLDIREIEK